ncbi:vacuolar protein sorting-associated protein VTA1 homolog isoform X2 [Daktulosphaira vitifoliae]|uniref:vacuolar protein sorting-associated protein VTA1 homolog isoform X2 n=1 Tax=Daktulosphaira vitifoliae TaxID=58002 RepID=UPI0021A9C984|nr:vacuolar protein sorting-associated protein VTA1 homolog isoform X2 [Daktulosphaira vitifoliae]
MAQLPECPESLKKIQHYMKIASEHDNKDPVISYWSRLYALQIALTIDKSSKEAKHFLIPLMDWLEKQKNALKENDMIINETAAQAHFENYAVRLFNAADTMDHQENYNKNIVKLFFTAGLLMDVLSVFGDVSEEILNTQKYAKWKATYIHNCLKNGETPISGPPSNNNEPLSFDYTKLEKDSRGSFDNTTPLISSNAQPGTGDTPSTHNNSNEYSYPSISTGIQPVISEGGSLVLKDGVKLTPNQITKVQKYCKFASSALNYDDVSESISNLQKALKLLTTGEES